MTYNPSIPQATDLISNSQSQLLANFIQLNTQFAIDHTAFNTGSGNGDGFHKKVTLELQGSDPSAQTSQPILYNKQVSYSGGVTRNELFMRQCSNDGSAVIQLSDLFKAINTGTSGSTFLPGGLVLKWGQFTFSGTTTNPSFVSAFNSTAVVVLVSPFNIAAANTRWYVSTWGATTLTLVTTTTVVSAAFTYIAVGT